MSKQWTSIKAIVSLLSKKNVFFTQYNNKSDKIINSLIFYIHMHLMTVCFVYSYRLKHFDICIILTTVHHFIKIFTNDSINNFNK